MSAVVGKVAALFIMIAVGAIAGKTTLLAKNSIPYLNDLLLYIGTPCMVMRSLYTKELSGDTFSLTVNTLVFSIIYFIVMTILAILFVRAIRLKPAKDKGTYVCAMVAVNTGFMGFPITLALFGNSIFYYVVLENLVLNIYCYMAEPLLFGIGSNSKRSPGAAVKALLNAPSAFMILGFIMMLTGVRPPAVIDEVLEYLGSITVPLSMILVGLQLSSTDLRRFFNRANLLCSIFNMFVIPAVYFLLIHPLPFLTGEVKTALIFCAVMPSAVVTMAMAQKYGGNPVAASEMISVTTVISLLVIPLSAVLLTHLYL